MSRAPRVWLAAVDDAETVARLLVAFRDHLDLSWPSDNAFLAGVERLLDDRDTDYLLGAPHDDAPPAGVVQLRYRYGIWRAGTDCLVEDLFVEEAARGAGLGRALVRGAIERARERGCRRIELDVNEGNPAALALYESFGFSSTTNGYGARDLYLRRHLDSGADAPG
ncbi:MAG: family N-acetyltransferase [Solirubrobacterales bacterium]|jgi:GNAT superfamily N-acetyltransferase|nr:family N-acetyltransferase [Solirubrobacterales bacterium]